MKEAHTIRLTQALIASRVAYSLLYHTLRKTGINLINGYLRKAYRRAIRVPVTALLRLTDLGIHNFFKEHREAALAA